MAHVMELIMIFDAGAKEALQNGVDVLTITNMPIREKIARAKYIPEEKLEEFEQLKEEVKKSFKELRDKVAQEA